MTSKKLVKNLIASKKMVLKSKEPLYVDVSNVDIEDFKKLENDLNRLEKLEKVTNLLKELLTFEFRDSGWCYCISIKEDKEQECDYTTTCLDKRDYDKQEYEVLKEVLEDVKN